jgi:MoaA/NifB/PqqE/SkfB family radical SAM enzyme
MKSSEVKFLGHNIPPILPPEFNAIFAFRVHNTLDRKLYFHSHTSFYGSPINDTWLHLYVRLNGVFFKTVVVHNNNSLNARERATLYFPFRAIDEGEYRLEVVIAEEYTSDASNQALVLFETSLRVKRGFLGADFRKMVRRGLFTLLYTETPLRFRALQLSFYRLLLQYYPLNDERKKTVMRQYKEANRELAFLEKQIRKLQVASLPCYLGIDTTSKCNLHCKMCFREHVDIDFNSMPDMSVDILNQLISELFPSALTLNLSTIGEPLMSKHMEKLLKACADYQVYISVTTSGTLLRRDDFVKKLASVLHYIQISFDSASPERFAKLRSGASYEGVLQNAAKLGAIRRALPEPKFSLGFSMTLFRENLTEIPEVLRIVSEVGGNFLKTDIGVIFSKRDLQQSVLTCPELYNEVYEAAHEKARQIGVRLLMRPPFSEHGQANAVRHGICDYLYLSACVKTEGTLNPCYFAPLSSVSVKNGFRTAWNSEMMQQLRREPDTEKGHSLCRDCYVVLEGTDSVENRRKQFLKGDAQGSSV